MQKTISKSQLKTNMLKVFRELEANGEALIVTDRNIPVLRITPLNDRFTVEELFGGFQGQVVYHEDVDIPTLNEWELT